ncbi:MAG: hypothetical protein HQL84_06600 [Magnetococcales bacterium]|nr:hypothetical protein [Magnetococcales bacterium]MBF0149702.1 hypothetical protein [Magnetococcales bacterium]
MMVKKMGLLVASSLFVTSLAFAAAPQEDQEIDKRTCQKWAQEDGIAADKMEGYISKCMAELAGTVDQYGGQDAIPDSAPPTGAAPAGAAAPAAPAAAAPAAAAPAAAAPAAAAPAAAAPAAPKAAAPAAAAPAAAPAAPAKK